MSGSHFANVSLLMENKSFFVYSTYLAHPAAVRTKSVLPKSFRFITEMSQLRALLL